MTSLLRRRPEGLAGRRMAVVLVAIGLTAAACGSPDTGGTAAVADVAAAGDATHPAGTGSGEAEADDDEGPTEAEFEEAQLAFEQCMADAGIEIDFGGSGGEAIVDDEHESGAGDGGAVLLDGGDDEAFGVAIDECNEIFEGLAGSFEPSPEQEAEIRDAEAAFANCMTERGFELPEAGDEAGRTLAFQFDEDADLDVLDAAMEECSDISFGEGGLILGGADGDDQGDEG